MPAEPPLPTTAPKKNRVAPSTGQTPSKPLDPASSPNVDAEANANAHVDKSPKRSSATQKDVLNPSDPEDLAELNKAKVANGKEGNVGEVRRKVEEMTYEEGIDLDAEATAPVAQDEDDDGVELKLPPKEDKPDSAMSLETRSSDADQGEPASEASAGESSETKDGEGLKRKALDRSQSSFVEDTAAPKKAKDAEEVSHCSYRARFPIADRQSSEQNADSAASPDVPVPPAKKPQATFSSFSSKPSPFAAKAASPFGAAAGASSASPFASNGAASPSPFASAGASGSASAPSIFAKSGFGNYSNSFNSFSKSSPKPTETKEDEADETDVKEKTKETSSFGDILKADTGAEDEEDADKLQMTEQDGTLSCRILALCADL